MRRPHWRIIGERHELLLAPRGADPPGRGERLREEDAVRALDRALLATSAWGFAARTLAEVARSLGDPGDAREAVRRALRDGRLALWRDALRQITAPPQTELEDDALLRAPATADDERLTWIEIERTDMEGNPMRGERYWIKLTDGTVREGALNEQGRAYFGQLTAGPCEVRWPDRDGDATLEARPLGQRARPPSGAAAAEEPLGERTRVEVELLDMDGAPVPHEPYWIKLPDGTVRTGRLDGAGRVYFNDLDPGACEIRWPDRDDEATLLDLDPTTGHPGVDTAAQVETLVAAAQEGVPFCEECERARQAQAARA